MPSRRWRVIGKQTTHRIDWNFSPTTTIRNYCFCPRRIGKGTPRVLNHVRGSRATSSSIVLITVNILWIIVTARTRDVRDSDTITIISARIFVCLFYFYFSHGSTARARGGFLRSTYNNYCVARRYTSTQYNACGILHVITVIQVPATCRYHVAAYTRPLLFVNNTVSRRIHNWHVLLPAYKLPRRRATDDGVTEAVHAPESGYINRPSIRF